MFYILNVRSYNSLCLHITGSRRIKSKEKVRGKKGAILVNIFYANTVQLKPPSKKKDCSFRQKSDLSFYTTKKGMAGVKIRIF